MTNQYEQLIDIELTKSINKKLSSFSYKDDGNFYNVLLGADVMKIHAFVHGLKTVLGQGFFQTISYKMAKLKYKNDLVEREKLIGNSGTRADLVIGKLAFQLKSSLSSFNKAMSLQQKKDFQIWEENGYTPISATMIDSDVQTYFLDNLKPYKHVGAFDFWKLIGDENTYSILMELASKFQKRLLTDGIFKEIRNENLWEKFC